MSSLFELNTLSRRLRHYVELNHTLKPEADRLHEEALIRGEFERGNPGSPRFLADVFNVLFPRLFPET